MARYISGTAEVNAVRQIHNIIDEALLDLRSADEIVSTMGQTNRLDELINPKLQKKFPHCKSNATIKEIGTSLEFAHYISFESKNFSITVTSDREIQEYGARIGKVPACLLVLLAVVLGLWLGYRAVQWNAPSILLERKCDCSKPPPVMPDTQPTVVANTTWYDEVPIEELALEPIIIPIQEQIPAPVPRVKEPSYSDDLLDTISYMINIHDSGVA